jgi:hypothetical protein
MQAPVLELLSEADLVPVGIENHRHTLAPVHVLGLAGDLGAGFPESRDLGVDVVAVEPKRHAAGRVDLRGSGEAELERA